MSRQIIVATGNADKVREIRQILSHIDAEFVTMAEAGVDADIIENGESFEENALIKARTVAEASGRMAIADDSGLVVDALDGEPGIHSARFMGHDTSYDIKNKAIIAQVDAFCRKHDRYAAAAGTAAAGGAAAAGGTAASGKDPADTQSYLERPGCEPDGTPGPMRSARFVCAVAVAFPDGRTLKTTGVMEGRIGYGICGENGFGYDPIFFLPQLGKTSAEITAEEKNAISHRGQAFRRISEMLEQEL